MYISEINHCLPNYWCTAFKTLNANNKRSLKNSTFDYNDFFCYVSGKLSYTLHVRAPSLKTYSFNTVLQYPWKMFHALEPPGILVPELNWVTEETSRGPPCSAFLFLWVAPQWCPTQSFQSQDTATVTAFSSVSFKVLLAFVGTKCTEAVGWLLSINLLHHQVQVTIKILIKGEYLWRSQWDYKEGISAQALEFIPQWGCKK